MYYIWIITVDQTACLSYLKERQSKLSGQIKKIETETITERIHETKFIKRSIYRKNKWKRTWLSAWMMLSEKKGNTGYRLLDDTSTFCDASVKCKANYWAEMMQWYLPLLFTSNKVQAHNLNYNSDRHCSLDQRVSLSLFNF